MNTKFFTAGLIASLMSVAATTPVSQSDLEQRDPQIVCIGCVNLDVDKCFERSDPPNCNKDSDDIAADCNRYCLVGPDIGCQCCDVVDGEPDYDSCGP